MVTYIWRKRCWEYRGGIHHFSAESCLSLLLKITTGVAFSGSCNSPIQGEKRDLSRVFRSESRFSIILTRVKILVVFLLSNLFTFCVLMYSYFLLCVAATNSELMSSILCIVSSGGQSYSYKVTPLRN
jgi:hypothetical protein